LLRLPVPAPGNGHTDSATEAVRDALNAVEVGHPGGDVLPVGTLQQQVTRVHRLRRKCRFNELSLALPGLIRDLHTTLAAGRDLDMLLPLGVLLHVHVTRIWLNLAEAPTDLRRQAMFLARDVAREHNDPMSLASAAFALAETLTVDGAFDLANIVLDEIPLPPVTVETAGLVCATLAAPRALLVAAKGGDSVAPLREATEIAERFGEVGEADPLGYGFGPTNVAFRRITAALELGDVDDAVRSVRAVRPELNPFRSDQAFYWREAGRALALAGGSRELRTRAPDNEQLQQLATRAGLDQR
jgi:hypothetical protein